MTAERMYEIVHNRHQDYLWCNKDDDCHIRAEAVAVILEDIAYEMEHGGTDAHPQRDTTEATLSDDPSTIEC